MIVLAMLHTYPWFLTLILGYIHPLRAQSLFNSDITDENFNRNAINLPPKFLAGGDMDGFSLPEDTPVGTIVCNFQSVLLLSGNCMNVMCFQILLGLPFTRRRS